jgi:hypothetical protein
LEEEFNELKNEAEKTVNTRKAKNKKKPVFKKATSFSEIKEMPENSSTVIIKPEFGAPDVKNPFEDYDKDKDGEFPENNLADNI